MGQKQSHCTKNGTLKQEAEKLKAHRVVFYRSATGREPVREWLKQLVPASRKRIGEDLYTLQVGWPLGMPLVRKIEAGLWEQRSNVVDGVARIMLAELEGRFILLHGFIKKSQKTPVSDLKLARKRLATVGRGRTS